MTSLLFRPAMDSDLGAIYQLAQQRGIGMTSLPDHLDRLRERLAWSAESFKKTHSQPEHEYYFFVLEDTLTQQVIGTSAIESRTGNNTPFYSYRLSKHTQTCDLLSKRTDYEMLSLVNDNHHCSELCTLFLDPLHRYKHNGALLSRARFLFIAQFPDRFMPTLIAEMRGVSDEDGYSPFWEEVGGPFFQMSFAEADKLTQTMNKQFISDLMPKNPIYVNLLSHAAQSVIGKTHKLTEAAQSMLLHEGFHRTDYVDIFDGGPTLKAARNGIRTIANSQIMTVHAIKDQKLGERVIMANLNLDFRATHGMALLNTKEHACTINNQTAEVLQVKCGDQVRVMVQEDI